MSTRLHSSQRFKAVRSFQSPCCVLVLSGCVWCGCVRRAERGSTCAVTSCTPCGRMWSRGAKSWGYVMFLILKGKKIKFRGMKAGETVSAESIKVSTKTPTHVETTDLYVCSNVCITSATKRKQQKQYQQSSHGNHSNSCNQTLCHIVKCAHTHAHTRRLVHSVHNTQAVNIMRLYFHFSASLLGERSQPVGTLYVWCLKSWFILGLKLKWSCNKGFLLLIHSGYLLKLSLQIQIFSQLFNSCQSFSV